MNVGEVVFFVLAAIAIIPLLRLILIDMRTRRHIKKYHRQFWDEHIGMFVGGGKVGPSVFQIAKGLNDPSIAILHEEWKKALKQLLLVAFFLVLFAIGHIAWQVRQQ